MPWVYEINSDAEIEIAVEHAVAGVMKDINKVDLEDFFHEEVVPAIGKMTAKHFRERKSPDGEQWAPLKKSTIAEKRRRGYQYPTQPLVRTNMLRDSVTYSGQGPSSGGIREVFVYSTAGDNQRAVLNYGTSVEYAGYHMEGTRTIPARPFMGLNVDDTVELMELLVGFLTSNVKNNQFEYISWRGGEYQLAK